MEAEHLKAPFPSVKFRYPETEETEPIQTWAEIEKGDKDAPKDCLYPSMEEVTEFVKHVKPIETLVCLYPMFCLVAYV